MFSCTTTVQFPHSGSLALIRPYWMWWSPYSNFPSCPDHVLYGLWREEQGLLFLIQSSRILLRIIFCICSGLFSFFSCRSSLKPFAFLSSHWHIWRVQVSCFVEHSSIWAYLFPHVSLYIYIFHVWKLIYICFWGPAYKQICWKY